MATDKAVRAYLQFCTKAYESQVKKHDQKAFEEFESKSSELYDAFALNHNNRPSIAVLEEVLDYVIKAVQVTENTRWPNLQKETPDTKILTNMCRGITWVKDSYSRGLEMKMTEMLNKKGHKIHLVSIQNGPTTGHAEIMDVMQRFTSLEDYWKTFKEERLRGTLKVFLASDPAPRHKDEEEDFRDINGISGNILEQFNENQYRQVKTEAAELLIASCERTLQTSEPASCYHHKICRDVIEKCFDEIKLYDLFPDNAVVLGHMEKIEAMLLIKDFPTHKHVEDMTQAFIYRFIKHIKYGLTGARRKEAISRLNKLFVSVNQNGNNRAKECIKKPYSRADDDFGKELNPVKSVKDAFASITEAARNVRTFDDEDKFEKTFKKKFKEKILTSLKFVDAKLSQILIQCAELVSRIMNKLASGSSNIIIVNQNMANVIEFMVGCLEGGGNKPIDLAIDILERRNAINLRAHPEYGTKFLAAMKSSHRTHQREDPYSYGEFYRTLLKMMKSQKMVGRYEEDMYGILMEALKFDQSFMHKFAYVPGEDIKWAKNIERAHDVLDLILQRIKQRPEVYQDDPSHTFYYVTVLFIIRAFTESADVAKIAPSLARLFAYCKDQEWRHPTDSEKNSVHHELLRIIMENYLLISARDHDDVIKPMIGYVKELLNCGDVTLSSDANNVVMQLSGRQAGILGDYADVLIDQYLKGSQPMLPGSFQEMYKTIPDKFHGKLDAILNKMSRAEEWARCCIVGLFLEVEKSNPHVITASHVDIITQHLHTPNVKYVVIAFLQSVAEREPELLAKHGNTIMAAMKKDKRLISQAVNTIVPLACVNEANAEKYTDFWAKSLPSIEPMFRVGVLYGMMTVARKFPGVVRKHKAAVQKYKQDPNLKDSVQAVLDAIEGRSLVGLEKEVKGQEGDIKQLDERVTKTGGNVKKLNKAVTKTKKDIGHIKKDVGKAEGKINQLQDAVQETVDWVEELEHKALSHAPDWSRDVSKLLNPKAVHDWRLLSQRLGYSNDDIRNWATQPDPCMSMLDEWFATNKTREATHAVLKNLKEMNRTDAAEIVQRALKAVEDIIKDQPKDYANPPPVFISYQWGHQQEVRLLKRHLQSAGFDGWMDIGQMGGGDKLYEKIDQGVRAAKVVICCVSEKYAESPNCNREVNLCTTLGKPIIPLLMEKMAWPPPGSMGPIFGEYLFIRFFQRPGEETGDNRYWPAAKFQELLMQLRLSLVPDPKLITSEFKRWWDPPEEEIVIKPIKEEKKAGSGKTGSKKSSALPSLSVFISYQWGKQPQIKALYRRLTQLGYHCWLDIMQMGGGDSLYDKIDKGVRGCKVVLSCVTTKYALSANCRREVSLADALKKPIVPLLLERMAWPPEGPMSMPFTQLLYINFCKPDAEIQNHWECPQFEELLQKIREQVPNLDFDVAELKPTKKPTEVEATINNGEDNKLQQMTRIFPDTRSKKEERGTENDTTSKLKATGTPGPEKPGSVIIPNESKIRQGKKVQEKPREDSVKRAPGTAKSDQGLKKDGSSDTSRDTSNPNKEHGKGDNRDEEKVSIKVTQDTAVVKKEMARVTSNPKTNTKDNASQNPTLTNVGQNSHKVPVIVEGSECCTLL